MKLRLAWLADAEYADSYSARETRVLLRALARRDDLVCLWFAVGSTDPPHFWHGIRVFPIPAECLASPDFLETLIDQQHPHILLSNLPRPSFPAGLDWLSRAGPRACLESPTQRRVGARGLQQMAENRSFCRPGPLTGRFSKQALRWIHRLNPAEPETDWANSASTLLIGEQAEVTQSPTLPASPLDPRPAQHAYLPYLRGFDPAVRNGTDPTTVLQELEEIILNGAEGKAEGKRQKAEEGKAEGRRQKAESGTEDAEGFRIPHSAFRTDRKAEAEAPKDSALRIPHSAFNAWVQQSHNPIIRPFVPTLVMRQHLFCNGSFAQVMFELTNALLELGVPAVAQDEHLAAAKGYIHREEELFRAGAPEKYERVRRSKETEYDPEQAITVHFSLFKDGVRYARHAVFPSLSGRAVLYTTGNHTMTPEGVRQLLDNFERIVAPSWHVLRPYLEAGLPRPLGAVIPHGADPAVYSPQSKAFAYPTARTFKFLQNSFPWMYEKGWDLTLKAYGRAFSGRDDVCLILRVPQIQNQAERASTFGRLQQLVEEERAKPNSPEILLLEMDMPLNQRGGIYTGADCYVHPLRAEGFGITILEAMACGLPVIATAWSGPADFLSPPHAYTLRHSNPVEERTKNGALLRYHVEPDLDHLVYLMRYVYEHREEAKTLGQRASRIAHRDWTWKHAAVKLASALSLSY